ncbi:Hypothetical Protein FCC1311_111032 [Hondaea fermentalgiana]|uniref:Uncharacterized protein n=1 Tax=Hondaea fermentalgiana TaxID=2315210 RepID=A0A2R5GVK7_9STRA|nr:Hypothetical Protein FCC1311_111032 [Hondaea fermentalgiana]|eukprot:GBG34880.1 Hypothetical Protein FCC1311_111032 [Hondaea fermentalgiana]
MAKQDNLNVQVVTDAMGKEEEEENTHEKEERVPEEENARLYANRPIWLEVMNPNCSEWKVVMLRCGGICAVFICLLAIGFKGLHGDAVWAVGLASVLSPLLLRAYVFLLETLMPDAARRKQLQGHYSMVAWLGYTFMMQYAYEGLVAAFGWTDADARQLSSIRTQAQVHDERTTAEFDDQGRFFFDFLADTGDGFDSSYLVASLLAQDSIEVEERAVGAPPTKVTLPRAQVVVQGGDICYPIFTERNFHYRFAQPFAWAFPEAASRGESMYLAAGNHEYIDGLIGYRKYLLSRDAIGGWKLPQHGSYFAIRLPRDWILFVVDLGPEPEDIDDYQREWFDSIELGVNERIIMIYHVPEWIKNAALGYRAMPNLREWRKSLGDRVRAVLAGDLHYYRRMEEVSVDDEDRAYEMQPAERLDSTMSDPRDAIATQDTEAQLKDPSFSLASNRTEDGALPINCVETSARQFYVAGHGGAFNHGTHFPRVERLPLLSRPGRAVETRCDFPAPSVSQRRWDETWIFMFWRTSNFVYLRFIAATYMCMFFGVYPSVFSAEAFAKSGFASFEVFVLRRSMFTAVTSGFLYPPVVIFLIMSWILTTSNYELRSLQAYASALVLMMLHVGLQGCSAFWARALLDLAAMTIVGTAELSWPGTLAYCVVTNIIMYMIGFVLGGLITTVYFALAVSWFSWHYNEALSLIQIEDFKGFLRIAIREDGALEIYTIVTDKTPKQWTLNPNEQGPRFISDEIHPYLLEKVTLTHDP